VSAYGRLSAYAEMWAERPAALEVDEVDGMMEEWQDALLHPATLRPQVVRDAWSTRQLAAKLTPRRQM
jgi:hypothetical protein